MSPTKPVAGRHTARLPELFVCSGFGVLRLQSRDRSPALDQCRGGDRPDLKRGAIAVVETMAWSVVFNAWVSDGGGGSPNLDVALIQTREQFGAVLTAIRRDAGLSIRKVADKAAVPAPTVGGWYAGKAVSAIDASAYLADVLAVCGAADQFAVLWEAANRIRDTARPARPTNSPYRGLKPYTSADADLFFGRAELVAELGARVLDGAAGTGPRVIGVLGASGSGKSSLLQAGLLVWLTGRQCPAQSMTPGPNPDARLAAALKKLGDRQRGAALIIDQAEELWTYSHTDPLKGDPGAAPTQFVQRLINLADEGVVVLFAIRTDFFAHAVAIPALGQTLTADAIVVRPLTIAELKRVIVEPAKARGGAVVEPALVEVLLDELAIAGGGAHGPGALPLLSHALHETWSKRTTTSNMLTVANYRATGGIRGAIGQTAEEVWAELDAVQQATAERLFTRGVHQADTGLVRSIVRPVELDWPDIPRAATHVVIERFVNARLLTATEDGVQITHEALLHAWTRLGEWIENDAVGHGMHLRLAELARNWDRDDPSTLLSAGRTEEYQLWARDSVRAQSLTVIEREYLAASVAHQAETERAERRRMRRLVMLTGALFLVAVVSIAATVFAVRSAARETAQSRVSRAHEQAATSYTVRSGAPEVGGLLAVHAERAHSDYQTRSALLSTQDDMFAGRIPGNGNPHVELAFDRTGRHLVVASRDGSNGTVTLYDTATRAARVSVPVVGVPYAVSLDPTGRRIAVNAGRTISVFDVDTGQWRALPGSFNDGAATLRFNPVTGILATSDADGKPALWDAETLNPLPLPAGTITKVQSVAFSRDGQTMALADSGIVQIHRPGKPPRTIHESINELRAVALDAHGRRVVLADHNGTVSWWDLDSADTTGRSKRLDTAARSIDFGADNSVVALTQENHSVRLLDTATGNFLAVLVGHTDLVTSLAFSPDYSTLASTGVDGTVALWRTDANLMRHPKWADATALAYTVDGTILAAAAADGTVTAYDTATGEPVGTAPGCALPATGTADAVAVSADARYAVLSCNGRPGAIRISDLTTHSNVGDEIPVARFPPALALNADNTLLATGNYLNNLELWKLGAFTENPKTVVARIPVASTIRGLAFSPDGQLLAYAADNGTVAVYRTADLQPGVDKPAVEVLPVLSTSGTLDRRPGSEGFTYRTIAFSADSASIAVSGDDGSIRIWSRTPSGFEPTLILTSRPGNVHALAFSTDPGRPAIVTASRDGRRRGWTLDIGTVSREACAAAIGVTEELTDLGSLVDDWRC